EFLIDLLRLGSVPVNLLAEGFPLLVHLPALLCKLGRLLAIVTPALVSSDQLRLCNLEILAVYPDDKLGFVSVVWLLFLCQKIRREGVNIVFLRLTLVCRLI